MELLIVIATLNSACYIQRIIKQKTLKKYFNMAPSPDNAPLLEAIFELRWGEIKPGNFSYTQEEQSLFSGKISSAAETKGYKKITTLQTHDSPALLPMMVTHRFSKESDSWPCYQIGLGVFTANQINEGYSWTTFKDTIANGLEIFNDADSEKLQDIANSLQLVMRYRDVFYPPQGQSIEEFIDEHFHVKATLPKEFLGNAGLKEHPAVINLSFSIEASQPKGNVNILIANGSINGTPGLLTEITIQSKAIESIELINIESILKWSEDAHDLQKHSFETLINSSAYN